MRRATNGASLVAGDELADILVGAFVKRELQEWSNASVQRPAASRDGGAVAEYRIIEALGPTVPTAC